MKGVSIIICCYNSANFLPKTLEHLKNQTGSGEIPCELIIVDNASTDKTSAIAAKICNDLQFQIPVEILSESTPGLIHAREKGISHSSYNYLLFCDDDNWLSNNYVETVYKIMEQDSSIAALGGYGIPVYEKEPEIWFKKLNISYGAGKQAQQNGPVSIKRGFVYGAGSVYRKDTLEALKESGFKSYLTGRTGKKLLASEDVELGYALIMFGYKIWFDERLTFYHWVSAKRIKWSYVKKDNLGKGYSRALLGPYQSYLYKSSVNSISKNILLLAKEVISLCYYLFTPKYRQLVLNIHQKIGTISSQIENKKLIQSIYQDISVANWNKNFN